MYEEMVYNCIVDNDAKAKLNYTMIYDDSVSKTRPVS